MMRVAAAISWASVSHVPKTPTMLQVLPGAKAAIGQTGGSLPIGSNGLWSTIEGGIMGWTVAAAAPA